MKWKKDHKLPNTKTRLGDSSPPNSTTSPGTGDLSGSECSILTQGMDIGASPGSIESNLKPEDLSTS